MVLCGGITDTKAPSFKGLGSKGLRVYSFSEEACGY